MAEPSSKPWNEIKGKIICVKGSLTGFAASLRPPCSVEGLRSASRGKCPGIAVRANKKLGGIYFPQ